MERQQPTRTTTNEVLAAAAAEFSIGVAGHGRGAVVTAFAKDPAVRRPSKI